MSSSRSILIPLATVAVAGAVALGSGATWTTTTDIDSSVVAGELNITNTKDGAVLSVSKLVPGESESGVLKITNNSEDDEVTLFLDETDFTSTFAADADGDPLTTPDDSALDLKIETSADGVTWNTTAAYEGDLGEVPADLELGDIAVSDPDPLVLDENDLHIRFTVSLDSSSPNADQGKTATVGYTFEPRIETTSIFN